jgi:hypothetical protein
MKESIIIAVLAILAFLSVILYYIFKPSEKAIETTTPSTQKGTVTFNSVPGIDYTATNNIPKSFTLGTFNTSLNIIELSFSFDINNSVFSSNSTVILIIKDVNNNIYNTQISDFTSSPIIFINLNIRVEIQNQVILRIDGDNTRLISPSVSFLYDLNKPTTLQPTTLQSTTLQPTTLQPTTTMEPTTMMPTIEPTMMPTTGPTTMMPTMEPTTMFPTTMIPMETTMMPTTMMPMQTTMMPSTMMPTMEPTTMFPTTIMPTMEPTTMMPTTMMPTMFPTTMMPTIIGPLFAGGNPFTYNLVKSLGNPTILSNSSIILNNATDRVLSDIGKDAANYALCLEFTLPIIVDTGSIQAGFVNDQLELTLFFSKDNIQDYLGNLYTIDTSIINKIKILSEPNKFTFYINNTKYEVTSIIPNNLLNTDNFQLFFQSIQTIKPYQINDINFSLYELQVTNGNPTIINNSNVILNVNPDYIISYPVYDYNKFNFYMECVIDKLTGNDLILVGFSCPSSDYLIECMMNITPTLIADSFGQTYSINNNFPLKLGIYFSDTVIKYYINNKIYEKNTDLQKYPGKFVDINMQFFAYELSQTVNISNINFNAILK